jgi:nicotinate-nucleotide adenylyltransferase
MVILFAQAARCPLNAAREGLLKSNRVGIYAGAFNPVHSGHLAFALQALEHARLDKVVFLPERRPRHKPGVEHFAHRSAMLKRAVKPHPRFEIQELVDIAFTVERTLPRLKQLYRGAELVFLVGSDIAEQIPSWSKAELLLAESELVIGVRQRDNALRLHKVLEEWPVQPKDTHIFTSFAADISSKEVREALYTRRTAPGLLPSVKQYSNRNWLYVSLA